MGNNRLTWFLTELVARGKGTCALLATLALFLSSSVTFAQGFSIDTASSQSPITGLWWNQNESGWGVSLTQQYDVIFVAMYTYDSSRNPVWYVASNCAVSGNRCTGDLYRVTGGSAPTVTWNSNTTVTTAGTITLTFADNNTGTMSFTLNGVPGSKSITRQVFRVPAPGPFGLPAVIFSDVFQAFSATAGGYRDRGVYPTKASTKVGCGIVDPIPDRATLSQFVNNAGGSISVSTPTEWCGQIGSESNCLKQFDNVVVMEERKPGSTLIDIYMQGLVAGHMTTVSYDSTLGQAEVSSRTLDASVTSSPCSNSGQPTQAKEVINGNWAGYSLKYSPTSKSAALTASSMTCSNQTCNIVGSPSATVLLSSTTLWRTANGAAQVAGGAVSTDSTLASMFVCSVATLVASRTFDDCTFYSFKRL